MSSYAPSRTHGSGPVVGSSRKMKVRLEETEEKCQARPPGVSGVVSPGSIQSEKLHWAGKSRRCSVRVWALARSSAQTHTNRPTCGEICGKAAEPNTSSVQALSLACGKGRVVRVGEVPGSNPGAPVSESPVAAGGSRVRRAVEYQSSTVRACVSAFYGAPRARSSESPRARKAPDFRACRASYTPKAAGTERLERVPPVGADTSGPPGGPGARAGLPPGAHSPRVGVRNWLGSGAERTPGEPAHRVCRKPMNASAASIDSLASA